MGLDLVELVIAVESSFGLDIPDHDAERLETPRKVIDYLVTRLPMTDGVVVPPSPCLSQRAFYRVRAATAHRSRVHRAALRPRTALRPLLGEHAGREWKALGRDVGARSWPRLKGDGWLFALGGGVETLGEVASHLALYDAAAVRGPNAPWTRAEVEGLFLRLLERETGVEMTKYTLDSRFVRDMGLD